VLRWSAEPHIALRACAAVAGVWPREDVPACEFPLEPLGADAPREPDRDVADRLRIPAGTCPHASEHLGFSLYGSEEALYEQSLATAHQHLGEQQFDEAMKEGSHLTLDEAVALARSID
jgi:hypothetical protein